MVNTLLRKSVQVFAAKNEHTLNISKIHAPGDMRCQTHCWYSQTKGVTGSTRVMVKYSG